MMRGADFLELRRFCLAQAVMTATGSTNVNEVIARAELMLEWLTAPRTQEKVSRK